MARLIGTSPPSTPGTATSTRASPPRPTPTRGPRWPTPGSTISTSAATSGRSVIPRGRTTGPSQGLPSTRGPADASVEAESGNQVPVGRDHDVVRTLIGVFEGGGDPHGPHTGGPGAGDVGPLA